jgi:hypothetical protein
VSLPPHEDGPPGIEGPKLFDANEERPTVNPPDFDPREEETNPAIPAVLPQRKETRQITLGDVMDAIGKLNERVSSIDAGLAAGWSEIQALRGDMNVGFDGQRDLFRALHGVTNQIARDVGLIREQTDSALGAVSKLPPRLEAIEQRGAESLRLSCAAFDVAIHNEIPDDELQACETIVAAARRAAR